MDTKPEDWNPDIDDNNLPIGTCPHCGAEARRFFNPVIKRDRWECTVYRSHFSRWSS
jgi:transposase-like protein